MPIYVYKCTKCKKPKEVIHSMSEVDKPSEETLKEITCSKHKQLMKRVPQEPQLAGSSGGSFRTEKELAKDKKRQRKIRARHEFVNETIPKMKPGFEKEHFKRKYSKWKRKDHEKIK